jgi:hypothetical protein
MKSTAEATRFQAASVFREPIRRGWSAVPLFPSSFWIRELIRRWSDMASRGERASRVQDPLQHSLEPGCPNMTIILHRSIAVKHSLQVMCTFLVSLFVSSFFPCSQEETLGLPLWNLEAHLLQLSNFG